MKKSSRTFALRSWCALMLGLSGPGCQTPSPCEEQGVALSDNRDRLLFPEIDEDWVCYTFGGKAYYIELRNPPLPPPSPPPPDVSGDRPADPEGPKDPEGVVNAAIVLNSCFSELNFFKTEINKSISSIYFDLSRSKYAQLMFQRVGCFKDKANGCDAMRECIGIVQQLNGQPEMNIAPDPKTGQMCVDGTSYSHREFFVNQGNGDILHVTDTWVNCEALGATCKEQNGESYCAGSSTMVCDPATDLVEMCKDDRPFRCQGPYSDGKYHAREEPKCSDYGLTCSIRDCMGTGPACENPYGDQWSADDSYFSYKAGVACESATQLRACVGTNEALVDCTTFGQGFTCIPGPIAHCGFASECDDKTPVVCDGDSLVVCDAGRIRRVDCKSLGFTSCISTTKGAACSPGVYDGFIQE